ncbi:hypothetical protein GALL_387250 [mine drainage metagenome]|uniref:Uncharacterized protein n=1 Tax=mine drainage metagenome TaxID=410659 RepID=A0A1J5QHU3_9ZZZZ
MTDDTTKISGLSVYAQGAYKVQLSSGKQTREKHRVDLRADVDPATGAVRFYVDPEDLDKVR